MADMNQKDDQPKFVYQLVARGNGGDFSDAPPIPSTTVFTTEEKARKRVEKFKKMVTDPKKLLGYLMDNENLKIDIVPLEIVE